MRNRNGWILAGFLALLLFGLGHVVGQSMLEHREETRRGVTDREVEAHLDTLKAMIRRAEIRNDSLQGVIDTLDPSPPWR